jgi:exosortase A
MSAVRQPAADALPAESGWASATLALVLGLLLLGLLFRAELSAALYTWETSTAYNHCWLVLPVAAWLAWVRRDRLAALAPAPSPRLALLALLPVLAWLVAERLGIMEGRQLAVVGLLWVFVLSVLGWRVTRAMAVPLGYLVFLVPFGEFTVPFLQAATAWIIEIGLGLLGIPHYVDSLIIETPAGTFLVAEACAGLRFAVAALAFGALYAVTMFRSPGRRMAVMVLALVVPVLANGLRALGIVVLAQHLGSAEAAAADHVVYGWGFFSAVILLLVLIGLPFREDAVPAEALPQRGRPAGTMEVVGAVALAAALTATGPALATVLDRAGAGTPIVIVPRLVATPDCVEAGGGALRCADVTVTARLLVFPARATWAGVAAARRRLAGGDDEALNYRIAVRGSDSGTSQWEARQPRDGTGPVAVAAWLDGHPAGNGLRSRATQAWNGLRGGTSSPVVAAVAVRPDAAADATAQARHRAVLEAVVEAQGAALATQAIVLSRSSNPCATLESADFTEHVEVKSKRPANDCHG